MQFKRRSGECAVIYSVPSLERYSARPLFHVSSLFCVLNSCAWYRSLRKDIEDERLWQPGMELVENPLSSGAHAAGAKVLSNVLIACSPFVAPPSAPPELGGGKTGTRNVSFVRSTSRNDPVARRVRSPNSRLH